jgi:hypothetical protein
MGYDIVIIWFFSVDYMGYYMGLILLLYGYYLLLFIWKLTSHSTHHRSRISSSPKRVFVFSFGSRPVEQILQSWGLDDSIVAYNATYVTNLAFNFTKYVGIALLWPVEDLRTVWAIARPFPSLRLKNGGNRFCSTLVHWMVSILHNISLFIIL